MKFAVRKVTMLDLCVGPFVQSVHPSVNPSIRLPAHTDSPWRHLAPFRDLGRVCVAQSLTSAGLSFFFCFRTRMLAFSSTMPTHMSDVDAPASLGAASTVRSGLADVVSAASILRKASRVAASLELDLVNGLLLIWGGE